MEQETIQIKRPKRIKINLGSKICSFCGGKKNEGARRCRECFKKGTASNLSTSPHRRRDYRIYLTENGKNNNIRRLPQVQ